MEFARFLCFVANFVIAVINLAVGALIFDTPACLLNFAAFGINAYFAHQYIKSL